MFRNFRIQICCMVMLSGHTPLSSAYGLFVGVGVDYSTGNYGESQATDILFEALSLRLERDPWTLRLSIPYLSIRGPGGVAFDGRGFISSDGEATGVTTRSGLGDVNVSLARTLFASATGDWGIDMGTRVKIPTAGDTKGLGTGKADYAWSLDGYAVSGSESFFAGVGFRWLGDPPGTNYRNTWSGNVGVSHRFGPVFSLGILYDYRQSASAKSAAASEVTPFGVWKLGHGFKLQAYASIGLSSGSADRGLGIMLQREF